MILDIDIVTAPIIFGGLAVINLGVNVINNMFPDFFPSIGTFIRRFFKVTLVLIVKLLRVFKKANWIFITLLLIVIIAQLTYIQSKLLTM
ncbi:hypothetical protein [Cytobacillus sp. IB215665]|uniref:hypothetical protein n=1 Tax=Cytobacillus sp. IB215665 TaxID=3097357 RepID=UPI002A14490F|nr:hypothetical protein [Cytobacillus sp. IB215665]MDX8367149.1 hypothetical protein [Cytobacillus sp. IB215665]